MSVMRRLFTRTDGPSDWRRLLVDPETQWRPTKSAYESAVAWEAARTSERGLPPELVRLFDGTPQFRGATLLLGIPEHQVSLVGGGHPSQADLWGLIDAPIGVTSMAVEAKAGEPFDRTVEEWLAKASPGSGKPARLAQLCGLLGISEESARNCRYQLLHRLVAALLEAQRFRVANALFLVHAFGDNESSFKDYHGFASLLGADVSKDEIVHVGPRHGVELWIGWVSAATASEAAVRAAV